MVPTDLSLFLRSGHFLVGVHRQLLLAGNLAHQRYKNCSGHLFPAVTHFLTSIFSLRHRCGTTVRILHGSHGGVRRNCFQSGEKLIVGLIALIN